MDWFTSHGALAGWLTLMLQGASFLRRLHFKKI
jgi:hypothetical protein